MSDNLPQIRSPYLGLFVASSCLIIFAIGGALFILQKYRRLKRQQIECGLKNVDEHRLQNEDNVENMNILRNIERHNIENGRRVVDQNIYTNCNKYSNENCRHYNRNSDDLGPDMTSTCVIHSYTSITSQIIIRKTDDGHGSLAGGVSYFDDVINPPFGDVTMSDDVGVVRRHSVS